MLVGRARETERLEDAAAEQLLEALARDLLQDMGEHDEIREPVFAALAGRVGQGLLPGGLVPLGDRGGAGLIVGTVLQARRVGGEVPEGERLPGLGCVGQICREGLVEAELPSCTRSITSVPV